MLFYVLSKTLDMLAAPLTWALAASGVAAWALRRKRTRLALRLQVAAFAVLYLFSTGTVVEPLVGALESSAHSTMDPAVTYDVVVVLGGFVDADVARITGRAELSEAADRLTAGYDVMRSGRARNVLVTSGPVDARPGAQQLVDWGIPAAHVVIDEGSSNTHDNAVRSAEILRSHAWSRVLLVTSAMHMKRAQGCFRAAGIEVDTLPVDWHYAPASLLAALNPRATSLREGTDALREALGRLVYRVVGFTR